MSRQRTPGRLLACSLVLPALALTGCELDNLSVSIGCASTGLTADAVRASVDNTGAGSETGFIRVRDGNGTLLFEQPYSAPVTFNTTSPLAETYTYTSAPAVNPITFSISSPAGGALPAERVWYQFSGSCAGLPFANVAAVPTLSSWTLLGLCALLPALAMRRRATGRKR